MMSDRPTSAAHRDPYFTNRDLEAEADLLLAEFGERFGEVHEPPVPVEEINENHLRLHFEFMDMQAFFGVADVHGALWVKLRKIGVDFRLDPSVYPAKRGRYHFTLAHEIGHWQLHRQLFQGRANQRQLLPDDIDRAEYVCRSSDKSPLEYQANYFAAALLMPRAMLKRAWEGWQGALEPLYLRDLQEQQRLNIETRLVAIQAGNDEHARKAIFEEACRPLAEQFAVSAEAMRIRLEEIGLLQLRKEPTLF